jgi:hypothetical protein
MTADDGPINSADGPAVDPAVDPGDGPATDPADNPAVDHETSPTDPDPVLARRAQISRVITMGQRLGYALFAAFAVLVIVAFATHFPSGITSAATVCLIAGCVVLAPAMTFAYAVKAADREDRTGDWR